ncbi:MAG TPA: alpha/beta hydrolase [Burkholderiales bacterium]|nr:alpha/beta hydrolase [Burkholderiales bacterium]
MALYRGMNRAALDGAYNNGAAVKDSARIVAEWEARSARLRARHPEGMDLRYGPEERNRIDYFVSRRDGPVLAFIHGGYWQMRSKEIFSFIAEGPLAWGINVALIGYTLAPQKRLDGIVAEIHASLTWLQKSIPTLGGDPKQLLVSGWSAGGHLTAMAMSHPAAKGGLAISGIYDLEPMRLSYINDKLRLDEDEARRNSPSRTEKPLLVAYGADELPELRRQSEEYAKLLENEPTALLGKNHFTVLEELASPQGALTALVRGLAQASATPHLRGSARQP